MKAVQALNGELRNHQEDLKRRTFLFESLAGAMLYREGLYAERNRQRGWKKSVIH